jgi:outer membrane protein OmpA-like peptidoglycan-associated protein
MKKLITLIIALSTVIAVSQEYNKSSIEFEAGATKIRDVTSVKLLNFNMAYRYMFNTKFGAKIDGGYTNLGHNNIDYSTTSLQGIVNVGRVLEFESFTKDYTILAGIGGTYTYSKPKTNTLLLHRLSNFHISAFIDNEIRLWDNVFVKAGLDIITGVNSRPFVNTTPTQTTSILNFNLGIVVPLGKHKKHADWYIEEKLFPIPTKDTIYLQPRIIKETIVTLSKDCNNTEYVFFDNNSYRLDRVSLNAIKKIASNLEDEQDIHLTGYASPPASKEYNQILADNRCLVIRSKLISLGIQTERIFINPVGEIHTSDGNNVDLARYVEIKIK